MNKNTFTTVKLSKGEMHVYDFGTVKLHAYKTNDFIDNEVFILEKNGRAVIIESPCFFDNIKELEQYLENIQVEGMLIAYHGAGAAFMPEVPKYATQNAAEYSLKGGGKALRGPPLAMPCRAKRFFRQGRRRKNTRAASSMQGSIWAT